MHCQQNTHRSSIPRASSARLSARPSQAAPRLVVFVGDCITGHPPCCRVKPHCASRPRHWTTPSGGDAVRPKLLSSSPIGMAVHQSLAVGPKHPSVHWPTGQPSAQGPPSVPERGPVDPLAGSAGPSPNHHRGFNPRRTLSRDLIEAARTLLHAREFLMQRPAPSRPLGHVYPEGFGYDAATIAPPPPPPSPAR